MSKFQKSVTISKMDVKYEDDGKALLLLRSLLPLFKHFRTTFMLGKDTQNNTYVKMDENTKALKHMVFMRKVKRGVSHRTRVINLVTGVDQNLKSKGKEKKCYFHCGASDHWKRNCKIWKEKKAKAMTVNSNTVSVVISEESDGEFLAVTSSYNNRWSLNIY